MGRACMCWGARTTAKTTHRVGTTKKGVRAQLPLAPGPARLRSEAMEIATARQIAYATHRDQRDRSGELLVEHLERVAALVPEDAQSVAFLHDLLEWTPASLAELEGSGLTEAEADAVRLLTRDPAESFELHALRVAYAAGAAGRLARAVKLADIDDHLGHDSAGSATRPYGWARRHIAHSQERSDDRRPALSSAA